MVGAIHFGISTHDAHNVLEWSTYERVGMAATFSAQTSVLNSG